MCCVVSFEVLFYIKQKIIHHTKQQVNKQDNEMTISNDPKLCQHPRVPLNFEYQRRGMERLHSFRHCCVFLFLFFLSFYYRPFSFDSMKQRGRGSGFTLCMVWAHCPSNESLKCSSGLQLFSISNRSNEQQYGLYLLVLFNYVLYFLPFFFSFFLFLFSTGWWLAKPRGSFSFSRYSGVSLTYFWIFQHIGDAVSATDRTWH